MKLSQVKEILNASVATGEEFLEREVNSAFGCDLMSDVLAFVSEEALLLTGLMNGQVIRTAEMMDIKTIVFVRGKKPTEDIIELAKEYSMVIMTTDNTLYTSCGRLYSAGLGEE
jgi:heterodisulfide reductase subunit A-like polyferredoxin